MARAVDPKTLCVLCAFARTKLFRAKTQRTQRHEEGKSWIPAYAGMTMELGRQGYRSEEHTSELQSLMRISYAVFCLKKKKQHTITIYTTKCKQTTKNNIQQHLCFTSIRN